MWISSLLLNIVSVSLNNNVPFSNENMYPCPVKLCWLFFEPLHPSSFLVPRFWQYICLLNPLLCGRRDHSLMILNLVSMEDVVKLSTRTRWLSSLSWCLRVIEHCHAEGGNYRLPFSEIVTLLRSKDVIHRGLPLFWCIKDVLVSVIIPVLKKMALIFCLPSYIQRERERERGGGLFKIWTQC